MSDIIEDLDELVEAAVAAQNGGPPLDPAWVAAIAMSMIKLIHEIEEIGS